MRAVFMSAGGDPFIALLSIRLWQRYWYDEVDRFWVCYNNHSEVGQDVVAEFLSRVIQEPKVNLLYYYRGIGNGMPITQMCHASSEDLVMLLEDDGFIFTPGIVNKCFRKIEDGFYDAGGSPRFSCGNEVAEASKKKYGLDYSGYGDVGPNFWPNFFFCKRADLMKTDMNFASYTWKAGEYNKELDHTFKEDNHADTFGWTCVQLRAMGLRFFNIPQFHADPHEIENKRAEQGNWVGVDPFWLHGGSLSAGMGGYLSGATPDIQSETNRLEIESRCALWDLASEVVDGFDSFKKEYRKGIEGLIQRAELDKKRIQAKKQLYREMMVI